jgi:hypothetical protein
MNVSDRYVRQSYDKCDRTPEDEDNFDIYHMLVAYADWEANTHHHYVNLDHRMNNFIDSDAFHITFL